MSKGFESIDYQGGQIGFLEKDFDFDQTLESQRWFLREDLLQVIYCEGRIILDVGWYPSFEVDGAFRIVVVAAYQWEPPVFERRSADLVQLWQVILDALRVIDTLPTTE